MKLLLCGEGQHEIGVPSHWDVRSKSYIALEGWMQPLTRHVIGDGHELHVLTRRDLQLQPGGKDRLPAGHGAKAFLAKRQAVLGGYDAVIFMADADSADTRDQQSIISDIVAGFEAMEEAISAIACVPMSASESWLLADDAAWSQLCDAVDLSLPKRPEEIWGARDDPDANHPHRYFFRVCQKADLPDNRDTRMRIAQASNIVTIRKNCPSSFAPFIDALVALS